MLALRLDVCYQYKIYVNFHIIGFNILFRYPNCTKVEVYFSNRFIAIIRQPTVVKRHILLIFRYSKQFHKTEQDLNKICP